MDKEHLKILIKDFINRKEKYLELYLDPEGCTTCGEVWAAKESMNAKEKELWEFFEKLTIYKSEV